MIDGLRLCIVGNEYGYFHRWGEVSKTFAYGNGTSDLKYSFGIVEFADRVVKVEVEDIVFVDDINKQLKNLNVKREYQDVSDPKERSRVYSKAFLSGLDFDGDFFEYDDKYYFVSIKDQIVKVLVDKGD